MTKKPNTKRLPKPVPPAYSAPDYRSIQAACLDRAADHHLHLGYTSQAERLAQRAAELRGAA